MNHDCLFFVNEKHKKNSIDTNSIILHFLHEISPVIKHNLQEMFAVCLLDNGEYGVLSYDQNSEGDDLLCFSTIVDQDKMPLIIPHFSQVRLPPNKHIYKKIVFFCLRGLN